MTTPLAAFITGHSVRGCTGLTPAQLEFQRRSCLPPDRWLPCNFPYVRTGPFPAHVSLLSASLNNILHCLSSLTPQFRARHRDAVLRVFDGHDPVILLAGSCGLELLNNLHLPRPLLQRLHVFACGPVSRRLPSTASCRIIQGEHDLLSRCCHRNAHHRVPCSHLGYLAAPETLRHFNAFCAAVLGRRTAAP